MPATLTPKRLHNPECATTEDPPGQHDQFPLSRTRAPLEKDAIFKTPHRVGWNQPMAACILGVGEKIRWRGLAAYRLPPGQFCLLFLPLSLRPYQNDPNFQAISFASGQYEMPRHVHQWGARQRRWKKEPYKTVGKTQPLAASWLRMGGKTLCCCLAAY